MNILIIDNYDSFTYNLYHMVESVMDPGQSLTVRRNDEISLRAMAAYDKIIISPGPGLPAEAGITMEAIARYASSKSILGVCLGHQAIGEVFGGRLLNLNEVLHGKAIQTLIQKTDEALFAGCPRRFPTGRYHSWVIDHEAFPSVLEITATDELGLIMGVSHKEYDVKGVQFHPESVMTPVGSQILQNWVIS